MKHNAYYDHKEQRTYVEIASNPDMPPQNHSIHKPFTLTKGVDAGKVVEGIPLLCGDCGSPAKYVVINHNPYARDCSGTLKVNDVKEWLYCGVCCIGG
jgi:hypothetical protein